MIGERRARKIPGKRRNRCDKEIESLNSIGRSVNCKITFSPIIKLSPPAIQLAIKAEISTMPALMASASSEQGERGLPSSIVEVAIVEASDPPTSTETKESSDAECVAYVLPLELP
jgi:hypothetical protein